MREPKIELKKEYLVEKYEHKEDLPKSIRLEACTICQLNCPACYMRQDPEGVEKGCGNGMLSFENFKKIVDDNNFEVIELSNHGEIFLNPDLIKMMEYAHKKGIALTADNGVNLNKLTDKQAEALVKYEFDNIVVSIDGASQETYKQYRRNGNFDKVIKNIEKINFYKKKYKKEKPFLNWKFVLFGHNEHEVKKAQRLAKKLAKEVLKTKEPITMDSMNSYERRLVHSALANFKGISTESEGEEPNRKVVIKIVEGKEK